MKAKLSVLGKCILLILAGSVIGTLLLSAVYLVPVNEEIAEASKLVTALEEEYPVANILRNNGGTYFGTFKPTVLDNGTDNLILKNVFAEDEGNPLFLAMSMREYPRYWHGYMVILRPLFYFLEYADFRIWNGMVQMLLVAVTALTMWQQSNRKRYVLAFLTSYGLLMPSALALSLQYTPVFYIAFGASLLALRYKDALARNSRYVYFFLTIGMLVSYFDLLTYPLITWGFPLLWWFVAKGADMDGRDRMVKTVVSGIAWIGGYGLFWLMKWLIATPVLGYNVVEEAINQMFYRVGEVEGIAMQFHHAYERWEVFYNNWRHYEHSVYVVILVAWILWGVYFSIRKGWRVSAHSCALLLIACASVVWYGVLANHAIIHHVFTYRTYSVGILAFLLFLAEVVDCNKEASLKEEIKVQWRRMAFTAAGWLVCLIIGYGLSAVAREDIGALYGGEYQEVTLQQQDIMESTFIPTFSEIRNVGFCLSDDDGAGYCRITLKQGGEVIHELQFPMEMYVDNTYYTEPVAWKLQAGAEYKLCFELVGNESANLLITLPGQSSIQEFQGLQWNGAFTEGQLLGSVSYHPTIQSKPRRLYAALMCSAMMMAAASGLALVVKSRKK